MWSVKKTFVIKGKIYLIFNLMVLTGGGTVDVSFGLDDGVLGGNVKVGGASRFQVSSLSVLTLIVLG